MARTARTVHRGYNPLAIAELGSMRRGRLIKPIVTTVRDAHAASSRQWLQDNFRALTWIVSSMVPGLMAAVATV